MQRSGRDAILLSTATEGKQNAITRRNQRNDRRRTPRVRRVAPRRRVGGITPRGAREERAREPRAREGTQGLPRGTQGGTQAQGSQGLRVSRVQGLSDSREIRGRVPLKGARDARGFRLRAQGISPREGRKGCFAQGLTGRGIRQGFQRLKG